MKTFRRQLAINIKDMLFQIAGRSVEPDDRQVDFILKEIRSAQDAVFADIIALAANVTLRDYGGNERMVLEVIETKTVIDAWNRVKAQRAMEDNEDFKFKG